MTKQPSPGWDGTPEEWHEPRDNNLPFWRPLFYATGVLLALVVLALIAGWFFTGPAWAHDAIPTAAQPQGWKYPVSCCSFRDCRATAAGEVTENTEGFKLASTGEFVPHGDKRIKELSQDGEIHVCQQAGNFDTGRVLCLLIPPRSF